MKKKRRSIIESFTRNVAPNNKKALKALDLYNRAMGILNRVYLVTGKKRNFQSYSGSAIHVQLNRHGISSTQKI